MPTRPSAKVSGGNSSTAILAKKNEPPHSNRKEDEQEPVGRRHGQARRHCSMSVVLDAPATRFRRAGASVR